MELWNLIYEIKTGAPHARLLAAAPCRYPYKTLEYHPNYTELSTFTFPTIVSFSALGNGLYLFYRKNIISQFKNRGKNDRSSDSFRRK